MAKTIERRYRQLAPGQAEAYRVLALLPGAYISPVGLAVALRVSPDTAVDRLASLEAVELVQRVGDRWRLPDPYRAHALTRSHELAHDPITVLTRYLEHRFIVSCSAATQLSPQHRTLPVTLTDPHAISLPAPVTGPTSALVWLAREQDTLIHDIPAAAEAGLHALTAGLTQAIYPAIELLPPKAAVAIHRTGLASAQLCGEAIAEREIHISLAAALRRHGNLDEAIAHADRALHNAKRAGDLAGRARAAQELGASQLELRAIRPTGPDSDSAETLLSSALAWHKQNDDSNGTSACHLWLGIAAFRDGLLHRALGHFELALWHTRHPLAVARAQVWLGRGRLKLGEHTVAYRHLQQAASTYEIAGLHDTQASILKLRETALGACPKCPERSAPLARPPLKRTSLAPPHRRPPDAYTSLPASYHRISPHAPRRPPSPEEP
ncbi:hypothetical protein [Streptomyces botrytidirepellens]|uniref:hypothetical protein n=1 Tax=Streptomyces botrytidirepellens TaxID=2486417 RepID=UPI0011CDA4DF|nr:hypothetical protein [Streptomyces botrytidirepellens]